MNNKVFSFKESFRGMGKRVLKGAAITYASVLGLSTTYQVISHLQIKNYLEPKDKKALVVSSEETNPWDKIGMILFQPILGFPGFDAPTIHQRFLEWPVRRNLAKLGYSVDWLSHPTRQQILNLSETSKNYQGVILIGHGAMGYFSNSGTHIEQEKDFVMRLTCNQERKYESVRKEGERPSALDDYITQREEAEKEYKQELLNASDILKTDPSFMQGLEQKGLNAKKIFTYQGYVTPTRILGDALLGWNFLNRASGYQTSFDKEIQNIGKEISYKDKNQLARIEAFLKRLPELRNTTLALELKNIYPLIVQAKQLAHKSQNTDYAQQTKRILEKLEVRKKSILNLPLNDLIEFCNAFLGSPEMLDQIIHENHGFKAKLIKQFYKEWPTLSKLPDSKKREYLPDIQTVFKRHQLINSDMAGKLKIN